MANGGNFIETLLALNALGRAPISTAPITVDSRGAPQLPALPATAPIIPAPGLPQDFAPPFSSLQRPEPPPVAPDQPIDRAIIQRFLASGGGAPVAPVARPTSTLEKVAAALGGVSAGLQGRGPEFVAGLREQRERPQREFERRREQFEERQFQLRLLGTREAQRQAEAEQQRIQVRADRQFDREFDVALRREGLTDQMAIDKFRDALLTERESKRQAAETKEQQAKFNQQIKIEKARIRKSFLDQLDAKDRKFADELAAFTLGETDTLSQGALRANTIIQARLQRLQRPPGSPGAQRPQVFAELSDGNIVPFTNEVQEAAGKGIIQVRRVFTQQRQQVLQAGGQQGFTPTPGATAMTRTGIPFAIGAPGGPQPGQQQPAAAQLQQQQQGQRFNNRAEAKRLLKAEGFTDAEAETELNRLRIP